MEDVYTNGLSVTSVLDITLSEDCEGYREKDLSFLFAMHFCYN